MLFSVLDDFNDSFLLTFGGSIMVIEFTIFDSTANLDADSEDDAIW